jgi:hypothetical protein
MVSDMTRASDLGPEDPARRLRSVAWLLQRSLRHPHRLPAGWRSERFGRSVDRTRTQLRPIHSLVALADSYGREGRNVAHRSHGTVPRRRSGRRRAPGSLEVAYATRWLELHGGREMTGWDVLSRPGTR